MIEVLLKVSGKWVTIYEDGNLSTDELSELADDCGLLVGTCLVAGMPDRTKVSCAEIAAVRFNHK